MVYLNIYFDSFIGNLLMLFFDITIAPRQCIICGKLAEYECRECFGQCGSGLESIAFCAKCMDKVCNFYMIIRGSFIKIIGDGRYYIISFFLILSKVTFMLIVKNSN